MDSSTNALVRRAASVLFVTFCGCVLLFLMAPILAIMPLSFNSEPFFTYPMPGFSLQWYREFFTSDVWQLALKKASSSRCSRRSPLLRSAHWPRWVSAGVTVHFVRASPQC